MSQPLASLSLDLDNQWSYLKTHGDAGWESFPSYFDLVVPRILAFFARHELRATVFVVGQDAALEKNHAALRSIANAGHEIGNHSFHHDPWLHLYSPEELDEEIAAAEVAIERVTGHLPCGFRGPGYSRSADLLAALAARGYRYDGSTLPTFLGPVARAYYFFSARLTHGQRQQRKQLFGRLRDGFATLRPHAVETPHGKLWEIPVTTMPIVRTPFHLSYLHYLAGYSESLAMAYFRLALRLCRLFRIEPSILLHPLDFLGPEDVPKLGFFPGMQRSSVEKQRLMDQVAQHLKRQFCVVTMDEHATRAGAGNRQSANRQEPGARMRSLTHG